MFHCFIAFVFGKNGETYQLLQIFRVLKIELNSNILLLPVLRILFSMIGFGNKAENTVPFQVLYSTFHCTVQYRTA